MAFLKIKNRAISSLASGVSDVATEWTLATGEGALFPTTGDFHVTCEDEIVKCTSRTGDVLTVVREQEGTTKAAHTSGKAVELRVTAGVIESIQSEHNTHKDLTTGVHGVGSQYIAKTRLSSQLIPWSPDLVTGLISCSSLDGMTTSIASGGSLIARGVDFALATGTTENNQTLLRNTGGITSPFTTGKAWTMEFPCSWFPARTNVELLFLAINDTTLPPAMTENHIGFKIVGRRIWSTSADGTTQTTKDTTEDIADTNYPAHVLKVVYIPGTSLKFYLDEVEISDHNVSTDKVPGTATGWVVACIAIKTTDTVNKQLGCGRILYYKEL